LLSPGDGTDDPIRGEKLTLLTGTRAVGFMIFVIFLMTRAKSDFETLCALKDKENI